VIRAARTPSMRAQRTLGRIVSHAAVVALLVFTLYPFFSMLITSTTAGLLRSRLCWIRLFTGRD